MKKLLAFVLLFISLSGQAFAALAIDGSGSNTGVASPITQAITTSNTNDIIIVWVFNDAATGGSSGITDTAGLSWTKRQTQNYGSGGLFSMDEWYAISSGTLSGDTVSVAFSGAVNGRIVVFGISGANTASPFDADASIPAKNSTAASTTVSVTISTANTNDILIASSRWTTGASLTSRPSGFSQTVASGGVADASHNIVTATQSGVTETYTISAALNPGMLFDAIKAAGGAPATSNLLLDSAY